MILRRWIVALILLSTIPNTTSEWDGIDEDEEETEQREDTESKIEEAVMESTALTTSTIPTTTKDFCHCEMEIYGPEVLEGVLKSPNYPSPHCGTGKCIYKILPHPNMSLHINIESLSLSTESTLTFWNIVNVEKKEYLIYNSVSTGRYSYNGRFDGYNTFSTAVNVGFKAIFKMHNNEYSSRGFKIKFERVSLDDKKYLCPPSHVPIGPESTEVSVGNQTFESRSGCTFVLTRSSEGIEKGLEEMYIHITTERGVFVSVRRYDEDGVFTNGDLSDRTRGILVDATRVEVVFRAPTSDGGPYNTPNITAMLMGHTCECPEPEYILNFEFFHMRITSPGFPDLYCPGKKCNTLIKVSKIKGQERMKTDLIFVETNCSLSELDLLELRSADSSKVLFRSQHKQQDPSRPMRAMVFEAQNLAVEYTPSNSVQTRFFEMNLTRMNVLEECVCSVYDSKVFETNGKLTIPISSRCHLMHCHWKFSNNRYDKLISVTFKLENPYKTDLIYMYSDNMMEEYGYGELSHVRQVTSPSAISMTFSRMKWFATPNATLKISWEQIERCLCPDESFYLTDGKSLVITSPHWPQQYCSMLLCRHTFFAPKGHFLEVVIDNADIERYHDYLKIYDGNSTTDPLLMKLENDGEYIDIFKKKPFFFIFRVSGLSEKVIQFNSTQNTVMFVFHTDESGNNKGYHANVICHFFRCIPKYFQGLLCLYHCPSRPCRCNCIRGSCLRCPSQEGPEQPPISIHEQPNCFLLCQRDRVNNNVFVLIIDVFRGAALNVAFEPGTNENANTTELETELL
ncbi:Protein CBG17378 [Caenorhabditis briggsae]|uniref:Protein CBG17378 n=1 Tax=Caenorhabditis briggsae TaxID=6238 RepID=A8XQY0_CAEBR|nr:Protein CBG17378 [Caenorhabditis briggsae]CAP35055.2 Protein CBG17378 [Caenorhabditis briggsae]